MTDDERTRVTEGTDRGQAMLAKCEAALKALMDAGAKCETLLKHDIQKVPHDPERRYDQEQAGQLLSDATGAMADAAKLLRTARALIAYANRPER